MNARSCVCFGGLLGTLGVVAGAFGAHAMKGVFSAEQLDTYEVAVRYQLLHAVALVLVGLLADRWPGRAIRLAGWAFLLGVLLFSGSLYAWILTGVEAFVLIVPLGGTALIVGWAAVAVAGWSSGEE